MEITMENGNNLMEYTSLIKEAENKFESAMNTRVQLVFWQSTADRQFQVGLASS